MSETLDRTGHHDDMTTIAEHNAHAPHLQAVADTLRAAGITVDEVESNANDPRDGYIAINRNANDGHDLVLTRDEERGWLRGVDQDGHGDLTMMRDSWPTDVLATPAEVVVWRGGVLAGTDKQPVPFGGFHPFRDYDNTGDGFEARLRSYWPDSQQEL